MYKIHTWKLPIGPNDVFQKEKNIERDQYHIFLIWETGIEMVFSLKYFKLKKNLLLFKMPRYKAPRYIHVQNK